MITTIQVHKEVKDSLDELKSGKESYEDVIIGLIKQAISQKRRNKKLLEEGYKEMYELSRKINKEWGSSDAAWPEY